MLAMEHVRVIDQLERHIGVFRGLLEGRTQSEQRWLETPEKWSLQIMVCHLYDEEREDFRARVKHVLETPDQPMPKIDPQAWITERRYMEQDYDQKLQAFLDERARSVEWLRSLNAPKWSNAYQHPKVGPVSAELLLANWLAHDQHHIRQINAQNHALLAINSGQPLDYAGTW